MPRCGCVWDLLAAESWGATVQVISNRSGVSNLEVRSKVSPSESPVASGMSPNEEETEMQAMSPPSKREVIFMVYLELSWVQQVVRKGSVVEDPAQRVRVRLGDPRVLYPMSPGRQRVPAVSPQRDWLPQLPAQCAEQ